MRFTHRKVMFVCRLDIGAPMTFAQLQRVSAITWVTLGNMSKGPQNGACMHPMTNTRWRWTVRAL